MAKNTRKPEKKATKNIPTKTNEREEASRIPVKIEKAPEELLPLQQRKWNDPEVFEVNPDTFKKPGVRIALISGIAYLSPGFRKGLIRMAFQIAAEEGVHFSAIVGHIIDKTQFQSIIKRNIAEYKGILKANEEKISAEELTRIATEQAVEKIAGEISSCIPRLKKPGPASNGKNPFVRSYISASPVRDGVWGNYVARKLQERRADDMRARNPGDFMLDVKSFERKLGFLSPQRNRLPSRYYTTAAENEIRRKERQTSQDYPYLWVIGGYAASVFTPKGLRPRPYIMLPDLHRLQEVHEAENQIGLTIIEQLSEKDITVRVWSFRDLIKNERMLINSPKDATKKQRDTVEVLKKQGAQSVGLISDRLELPREQVEKDLKTLLGTPGSSHLMWPGIRYNAHSQDYDFHLPWIQKHLRYPVVKSLKEDSMLFFGCLHAGYTTTDYEHFVEEYPRLMLEQNVMSLFGVGDLTAGLHHDFHHTGEVFGGLNYTEQEEFAAELVATVMFRVFKKRFEKNYMGKKLTGDELTDVIRKNLVRLFYIPGNHDLWPERDGHTPLKMFHSTLVELLVVHIGKLFQEANLPFADVHSIIKSHVVHYEDFEALVELPSCIKVSMQHPHMGRAQTTSLRAQHAVGHLGSHISALANFHTSIIVAEWNTETGQCISVQIGTQVIYTRFERRKMKTGVDFGPVFLRVFSKDNRVFMHEMKYSNEPRLKEAIPKTTDPAVLKKKLGLLTL